MWGGMGVAAVNNKNDLALVGGENNPPTYENVSCLELIKQHSGDKKTVMSPHFGCYYGDLLGD